tara:strand:- start:631 stop:759 length:129 start_codon:yes stop_codon:yes gene_type:complete
MLAFWGKKKYLNLKVLKKSKAFVKLKSTKSLSNNGKSKRRSN